MSDGIEKEDRKESEILVAEKVCVIGIWHLGSVVSTCLADLGYSVVGMDKDANKVKDLNSGIPPLFEPGLQELLSDNIKSERLSYTADLSQVVKGSGYVLITFDTLVDENDEVELSEIFNTSIELSKYLENDSLIIVSSQVPIGTCEQIKSVIKQNNPSLDFDIAYSPENLRLGRAIEYFKNPDRVIIGADSSSTLDRVEAFFGVIKAPKLRMNLRSAEMAKHALNAFLATSISFANEIGNLCDELGADALDVAAALQSDIRLGPKLPLKPGLAFSGGTLARDLKVLKKLGESCGCETHLIDGVLSVNQRQNGLVLRKLQKVYGSVKNLTVGILGLTYKAGTSTLRRSAALEIIRDLVNEGATVKAYDPKASLEEIRLHTEFEFCREPYEVARDSEAVVIITEWPEFKNLDFDLIKSRGSEAVVIITEWPEFKNLDFDLIKSIMKKPVLIDTKNMLDREQMLEKGFLYLGVGRGLN